MLRKELYVITKTEWAGKNVRDEHDELKQKKPVQDDWKSISVLSVKVAIAENVEDVFDILKYRIAKDKEDGYVFNALDKESICDDDVIRMRCLHIVDFSGSDEKPGYYYRQYNVHKKIICECETDKEFAF